MAIFPNVLTTRFLDSLVKERPDKDALRKSYIGTSLMPVKDVGDYEILWDVVRSANRIAGIYAMDGTPIPGDDPGFYQMMANVMNIMAARKLDEETVMVLREPGELAVQSRVLSNKREKAMRMLRDKAANADNEVDSTIEYLILQAIQGSIVWPPKTDAGATISGAPAYWGNGSFTLDLDFRTAFKQSASTLSGWEARAGGGYAWTHASADPILDIEIIRNLMVNTLHMPLTGTKIIMDSNTLSWIGTRPKVIDWFHGNVSGYGVPGPENTQQFIDNSKLQTYVKNNLGFDIVLYDSVWTYESNVGSEDGVTENWVHFMKPGRVLFIPPFALGPDLAYFATAPAAGPDQSYRPGKYTWVDTMQKPPWTVELGVGMKGFPIMKTSKEIFVLEALS